jgi:hypothetical protein
MRDGKEIAGHDHLYPPKEERVLHRLVLTGARGDPSSFSGVLPSQWHSDLEKNHIAEPVFRRDLA